MRCNAGTQARQLCWTYIGHKSVHLLEEGQNMPIVRFTYLCHTIGVEFVLLSFLYIKFIELSVKVAFYNGPAVAYYKVDVFK